MTLAQRVLSAIAHPQIAYLLLTLGTLGLTIELWSPGAVLPGVAGGICLLLAFFAFQVLPVSYAGVLLILFGLVLLVLEVKVTSYGLLGVGGVVVAVPGLDDAHRLAAAGAADRPAADRAGHARRSPAILVFLVTLAVKAQRTPPVTGASACCTRPAGPDADRSRRPRAASGRTGRSGRRRADRRRYEAGDTGSRRRAVEGLRLHGRGQGVTGSRSQLQDGALKPEPLSWRKIV